MRGLKKNSRNLFEKSWPFLVIVAITFVFFWKVFLLDWVPLPGDFVVGVYYPWLDYKWGYPAGVPVKNPLTTDVVSFTYPMQTLAIDLIKRGQLPLWNPYILAGTPLLANFQSAPFSPTSFVYFIFDKIKAWSFQIALQHILAAYFTYILLRHWKVSQVGSSFGATIFAFSGFNLIWSQWNGHALAASFIPLILFFEDRFLLGNRWIDGASLSASVFFLFLSGYPQVAIYLLIAIVILWLIRIWRKKGWLKKTIGMSGFFILGLGLSAFQTLPGAELLSLSQRAVEPHPYEWAFLPWSKVITFFAPDYFGNHATGNYWGPQDYTSNTGFVGVVAFSLASVAIFFVKKRKEILFSLILLVFSLLMAFPTPISIFLWKSGIFGLNAASAHRSLVLFNLSVGLLAGFGVDYFLKKRTKTFKSIFIPLVVISGFAIYAFSRTSFSHTVRGIPIYLVASRNVVLPIVALLFTFIFFWLSKKVDLKTRKILLSLLFFILIVELFRFGWKFTPFSPRSLVFPTTPVLDFLISQSRPARVTGADVIPINLRMPYKLESLEGYDAVYPLRISQFIGAVNSGSSSDFEARRYGTVDNVTSPLMDLVNTKFYLAIKRDESGVPSPEGKIPKNFEDKKFQLAFEDKSVAVLKSTEVLARAFMVYDWERIDDEEKILETLLDPKFPLDKKIVVEDFDVKPAKFADWDSYSVSYKKYEESGSVIEVETFYDGLLFVSDTWFPGWKAYVDGKEEKIYRANFAFRAVAIPSGKHEVRFVYQPNSFNNGLKISALSFFFLFLSTLTTRLKRKGEFFKFYE